MQSAPLQNGSRLSKQATQMASAPAVVYTPSFGDFVLGVDVLDAGASREWERRTDAPLALRLTLGGPEDGQEPDNGPRDLVRLARRTCMHMPSS